MQVIRLKAVKEPLQVYQDYSPLGSIWLAISLADVTVLAAAKLHFSWEKVAVVNLFGCASVFCLLHLQRVLTAALSAFVTRQAGQIACLLFCNNKTNFICEI